MPRHATLFWALFCSLLLGALSACGGDTVPDAPAPYADGVGDGSESDVEGAPGEGSCDNGTLDHDETDVDCGGLCAPCAAGRTCSGPTDCADGFCLTGICQTASSANGGQDGTETDVDCGGATGPGCPVGQICTTHADCAAAQVCANGSCANGCEVGVTFFAAGARGPHSSCQTCQPDRSTTDFTALADGTSCGHWLECKGGDCKSTQLIKNTRLVMAVSLIEGAYPGQFNADPKGLIHAIDAWVERVMGVKITVPPPRYRYSPNPWPASVSLWSSWGTPGPAPRGREFPDPALLQQLSARGITPMIFWEPTGAPYSDYKLSRIAAGGLDEYIRRWARAAKQWGKKVIVRLAHEQTGSWFPWSPGQNGNTAADYKKAWRRVFNIVRKQVNATNVKFFWCPMAGSGDKMLETWVGDAFVDYTGLDGYEWMKPNKHKSMKQRFAGSLNKLRSLPAVPGDSSKGTSKKPIIIGETGIAAVGQTHHQRATWLRKGVNELVSGWGKLKGIHYFDIDMSAINNQPNWRLAGTPDIQTVFARLKYNFRGTY